MGSATGERMQKKVQPTKNNWKSKNIGVQFEALEPRLLLSGSWGAAVDAPSMDSPSGSLSSLGSESVTVSEGHDISRSESLLQNQHALGAGTFVDVLASAPVLDAFDTASGADSARSVTEAAPTSNQTATESEESQTKISGSDTDTQNDMADAIEKRELVFINDNVADYEKLIDEVLRDDTNRNIELAVLDSDSDGIEQVSDILAGRSDLAALHFITHGSEGQINLGNVWLNSTILQNNSNVVAGWGNALSENGDILFYGCNIAADSDGQRLLTDIASLTGADAAASDDNTGHTSLNGDWEIEYRRGEIETAVALGEETQRNWSNVLVSFTVDTTSDTSDAVPGNGLAQDAGGETSLRAAIEEANALAGADTITLGSGTYTLSLGELTISSDITINGAGVDTTVIDGDALSRVFNITSGTVTISNLTIQGGLITAGADEGAGVAVASGASVTLDTVNITGNHATGAVTHGGGIFNAGDLRVINSTISGNSAVSGGGGLWNEGTAQINRSLYTLNSISNGSGGAIYQYNTGSLNLTNVTLNGQIRNCDRAGGDVKYTAQRIAIDDGGTGPCPGDRYVAADSEFTQAQCIGPGANCYGICSRQCVGFLNGCTQGGVSVVVFSKTVAGVGICRIRHCVNGKTNQYIRPASLCFFTKRNYGFDFTLAIFDFPITI